MSSSRVSEWFRFADTDLLTAQHVMKTMISQPFELICYHCQQAAEKYLKGYLIAITKNAIRYAKDVKEFSSIVEVRRALAE